MTLIYFPTKLMFLSYRLVSSEYMGSIKGFKAANTQNESLHTW
jgi:hypothetical protein